MTFDCFDLLGKHLYLPHLLFHVVTRGVGNVLWVACMLSNPAIENL